MVVFLLGLNYQPIRNVLSLIPFAAVASAASIVAASGWVARRWSLGRTTRLAGALGATVVLVGLLLVQGVQPALRPWTGVVDSRTRAVDWLQEHVQEGQRVLVAEEVAILPDELAAIPGTVEVEPASGPRAVSDTSGYDYVVTGRWASPPTGWPQFVKGERRALRARFGRFPVPASMNIWRGTDLQIDIFAGA
jgi:hypothetical protein